MKAYGINCDTVSWYEDVPTARKQKVVLNGVKSEELDVCLVYHKER